MAYGQLWEPTGVNMAPQYATKSMSGKAKNDLMHPRNPSDAAIGWGSAFISIVAGCLAAALANWLDASSLETGLAGISALATVAVICFRVNQS